MWVKLENEYVNLNHIVRVQFVRENDKLVAFVETLITDTENQDDISRYEGDTAEALKMALDRDISPSYHKDLP